MKNLILFFAIVCGAATVASFMAAMHAAMAASWTSQLCWAASPLCNSPVTLGLATAGLVWLWIFAADVWNSAPVHSVRLLFCHEYTSVLLDFDPAGH